MCCEFCQNSDRAVWRWPYLERKLVANLWLGTRIWRLLHLMYFMVDVGCPPEHLHTVSPHRLIWSSSQCGGGCFLRVSTPGEPSRSSVASCDLALEVTLWHNLARFKERAVVTLLTGGVSESHFKKSITGRGRGDRCHLWERQLVTSSY